jgi:hypothetical protein
MAANAAGDQSAARFRMVTRFDRQSLGRIRTARHIHSIAAALVRAPCGATDKRR